MTATKVTLILDRYDGAARAVVRGTATFTPSLEFPDVPDQMLIGTAPVTVAFNAPGLPPVELLPNDLYGPQQGNGTPGWTWNVTYSGVPGNPADASYYVLSTNGGTQRLSDLATVPAAQPGQQYVPLPLGSAPSPGDTVTVVSTGPLVTAWEPGSGIDGGSAVTGMVPAYTIDGGSATS